MEFEQRLISMVRKHKVTGAVAGVIERGSRAYAAAGMATPATTMTTQTSVHVASVTKPVVAAAVVLTAGSLLDSPVLDLIPELKEHWKVDRGLTLRDLLSHTSGLDTPVVDDVADSLEACAALVVGARQLSRARAAWQYCNAGYWLAGLVLARLRGVDFAAAVAESVLTSAGMHNSGFVAPAGVASGHRKHQVIDGSYLPARAPGGGLCSTAGDLLRFADFMFDRPELLATMTVRIAPTTNGSWYGLGWELNDAGVIWHNGSWGGFKSCLALVPRQRFAVAAVVNDEGGAKAVADIVGGQLHRATGLSMRPNYLLTARAGARLLFGRA